MNLSQIAQNTTANRFKDLQTNTFIEVELSKVYPNPDQPRKQFNDIEDLANSIQEHGLIEPIVVVKKDYKYMIIAGERRFKACQLLELTATKVHVIQADEKKILELSLIENIQRDDLTDFEIAKFVGKLMSSGNYPLKKDLAKAIGKSDSYISRVFSVLKLDDSIIEDIEHNKSDISLSVLDEISRLKDKDLQSKAYSQYIAGEIKRDDIKNLKVDTKTSTREKSKTQAPGNTKNNHVGGWQCKGSQFHLIGEFLKQNYNIQDNQLYTINVEEWN